MQSGTIFDNGSNVGGQAFVDTETGTFPVNQSGLVIEKFCTQVLETK